MIYVPIVIGVVISTVTFALLYRPFFGKRNDFWECVDYALKPDFFSWLNNDLQKDYGKSLRLNIFLATGVGWGILGAYISYIIFN